MRPDVGRARGEHPRAGLAGLLVGLALAGCADCTAESNARDFAGADAIDCGNAVVVRDAAGQRAWFEIDYFSGTVRAGRCSGGFVRPPPSSPGPELSCRTAEAVELCGGR